MVVRSSEGEPWRVIGVEETDIARVDIESKDLGANGRVEEIPSTGIKRERESSVGAEPSAKRARVSPDAEPAPCLAPSQDLRVKTLLSVLDNSLNRDPARKEEKSLEQPGEFLGAGDVFLTEGWRDRWCRCKNVSCYPYTHQHEGDPNTWFASVCHLWRRVHICWKKKRRMSRRKTQTQVCLQKPSQELGPYFVLLQVFPWRSLECGL